MLNVAQYIIFLWWKNVKSKKITTSIQKEIAKNLFRHDYYSKNIYDWQTGVSFLA